MKHRKALLPKQTSKSNSSHLICSEERVKSIFLQHKPLLQHPSQPSGHTHSLNNITSTQTKKTPPCLIAFLSTLLVSVRICCFMLDTALRQPTTNKAKPCQKKEHMFTPLSESRSRHHSKSSAQHKPTSSFSAESRRHS